MAEPSDTARPDTKACWERLVAEQINIFSETLNKNQQLLDETRDLKDTVIDSCISSTRHKEERLLEEIHDLEDDLFAIKEDSSTVLCAIDGDGCIPSDEYLRDGRRSQLYVVIYLNLAGLCDTLVSNGVCTAREFEGFVLGFNQASPLFSIVDVGYGKEAADVKLRVRSFHRKHDKIFFGGGHDGGYATLLHSLDTEGLLEKVTILRSYKRMAADIENMRLPSITIDGLFLENRPALLPGSSSGSGYTGTTRVEGAPSDTGYEYPRSRTFPPQPPLPPSNPRSSIHTLSYDTRSSIPF